MINRNRDSHSRIGISFEKEQNLNKKLNGYKKLKEKDSNNWVVHWNQKKYIGKKGEEKGRGKNLAKFFKNSKA